MDTDAIARALEMFFDAAWANRTPVFWDNQGKHTDPLPLEYVKFQVEETDRPNVAMGGNITNAQAIRDYGVIVCFVIGPVGDGTRRLRDWAAQIAVILDRKKVDSIQLRAAIVNRDGLIPGSEDQFQFRVVVPYLTVGG